MTIKGSISPAVDRAKGKSGELALSVTKDKGKSKNNKKKCSNCLHTGHTSVYQPGGGKEGQAPWQQKDRDGAKDGSKSASTATKSQINANSSQRKSTSSEGSYAFAVAHGQPKYALNTNKAPIALVDTAATAHFCPDREKFVSYRKINADDVYMANGNPVDAIAVGDVKLQLPNGSQSTEVTMRNVFHVPSMTTTLISVGHLDKAGYLAHFGRGKYQIEAPDGTIIADLPLTHGLYTMHAKVSRSDGESGPVVKRSLVDAHRLLGHIHYQAIRDGIRGGYITGIELEDTEAH